MGLDEVICNFPIVGSFFKRLYSYFRKHILFTDLIHVVFGLGLGVVLVSKELFKLGIILIFIAILGHLWAFIKGKE